MIYKFAIQISTLTIFSFNNSKINKNVGSLISISAVKNQLEQQAVKAQTHAEGLQTRLNERDEKIQYLEKELDEEQLRHDQIGGQITALKERFGIASAQAESLQGQLQQAQENVLRKEQEQQKTQEKLTAL